MGAPRPVGPQGRKSDPRFPFPTVNLREDTAGDPGAATVGPGTHSGDAAHPLGSPGEGVRNPKNERLTDESTSLDGENADVVWYGFRSLSVDLHRSSRVRPAERGQLEERPVQLHRSGQLIERQESHGSLPSTSKDARYLEVSRIRGRSLLHRAGRTQATTGNGGVGRSLRRDRIALCRALGVGI